MSSQDKLLSLLDMCSDNKSESERLSLLAGITCSSDYNSLCNARAIKAAFEKDYSFEALERLNNNELQSRKKMLKDISTLYPRLIKCLYNGNAPELGDAPDLTSEKSISKLLDAIKTTTQTTNYSNINVENALLLFEDSTIRSAQECLNMLPVSLTKKNEISEKEIKDYMDKTYYCVNIEDFQKKHKEFLSLSSESEQIIEMNSIKGKKRVLMKICVTLITFASVFICSQFKLLDTDFLPVLYGSCFGACLLYWILG